MSFVQDATLLLPLFVSFILTALVLPIWIRKCRLSNLLWEDMNKFDRPKNVASSGGVVVVMAFVIAVLFYVGFRTLFRVDLEVNIKIFALLTTVLIFAIVGLTDDLLGWKNGGLSRRVRTALAFVASIPLVVISAGSTMINIPFIGPTNLGWIYVLILIPLGVAGASTTYNFLAGFNGLEAGQGIIFLSFLSLMAYITGSIWLGFICLIMVMSLIVFYYYNKVPAKVFPGDILTYTIGSMIAVVSILGNFERVALFAFIPYIMEVILKTRGKLVKSSFGMPQKDGSLKLKYDKIYGMTHLSIYILSKFKSKVYEKDVTHFIFSIQIVFCLIAYLLFMFKII